MNNQVNINQITKMSIEQTLTNLEQSLTEIKEILLEIREKNREYHEKDILAGVHKALAMLRASESETNEAV